MVFEKIRDIIVDQLDAEADDVLALGFKLAGLGGHGQGLALGHVEDSV